MCTPRSLSHHLPQVTTQCALTNVWPRRRSALLCDYLQMGAHAHIVRSTHNRCKSNEQFGALQTPHYGDNLRTARARWDPFMFLDSPTYVACTLRFVHMCYASDIVVRCSRSHARTVVRLAAVSVHRLRRRRRQHRTTSESTTAEHYTVVVAVHVDNAAHSIDERSEAHTVRTRGHCDTCYCVYCTLCNHMQMIMNEWVTHE
jgi:hypothetical protein